MTVNVNFQGVVNALIEDIGFTPGELAKRIGSNPATISRLRIAAQTDVRYSYGAGLVDLYESHKHNMPKRKRNFVTCDH